MADTTLLGSNEALKALKAATRGLLFPSESDRQIEAFLWKKSNGDQTGLSARIPAMMQAFGMNIPDGEVQVIALDDFLAPVTTDQPWFGAEEKATAQRFRDLEALLQRLSDANAYRFTLSIPGEPVTVYICGRTSEGDVAGVTTELVET